MVPQNWFYLWGCLSNPFLFGIPFNFRTVYFSSSTPPRPTCLLLPCSASRTHSVVCLSDKWLGYWGFPMVMEEETKLVPKNGSDCDSNGASSAAANGKYDLCGMTRTSEVKMDEISAASLIKHDPGYLSVLCEEVQRRWLNPAEVMYILQRYEMFEISQEPPQRPPSGSVFLFHKRVLRFFRKDGHNWQKKRGGRTVGETIERLKVGNVEALNCYIAHGEQNPTFQRRIYWMLDPAYEHIVLVHYGEISENSDAANDSISSTANFIQWRMWDPHIADDGSSNVHVASNRVTEDEDDHDGNIDLSAAEEDDDSIFEITDFSRWEKGESIGAGGYGTVYVARNRETRALCAIKELKDIHKLGNTESLQKEIEILSQLQHTNVVKYYGHETVGRDISLYMEYIEPGSLKEYILKHGVLPEPLIRNFAAQILSGLVYLHSKRVVHRDIKPHNLLVDSNNIVKLVDFGLAKHLEESVGNHSILGTPCYAAPEVFDKSIEYHSSHEAYAADIWSLGCVIIEMFSGNHPWPGFNAVQVIFNVHFKHQHPPIPEKLCQEGNDFLKLCFSKSPTDRPSASTLLDHPFVKPQTT